jgi:hypothetical protein
MTCEQSSNEAAHLSSVALPDAELLPAVRELAQAFRQRLGTLDPQQVAIWQQMTPAKKIRLAFQMYDMARRIIWTTERQAHPDASLQELSWRVLRRMHGKELCFNLQAQMS